ncbi:hypothetical protein [Streptomyces sp. NPDC058045]|uniref:hypothetical protein n=1 Tax=Streptomyces sp. NPDC058045 TaxID=3346311 RepID=UPI0036E9C390
MAERGFQSHKLAPAGYKLPVVNDCLVYVWRVPEVADAVANFASRPTRKNGFVAPRPDPMLFDLALSTVAESPEAADEEIELEEVVQAAGDTMPLILVMIQSSPHQLQSIKWAIAELNQVTGKVELRGQETIWEPELDAVQASSDVEPFDSGMPVVPAVKLQKQEGTQPDA